MTSQRNALIAVTSLFFLWALAHNLNPVLIPHLKKACRLSDLQSALVDSSFYLSYFLMALPAGMFIRKVGYQRTIVSGLLLFAIGALLFLPAASMLSYGFFLAALFVIGSGLTLLETAANPYVSALGEPETATRRLNFAQAFNGLGATLAAGLGGTLILSGKEISNEMLHTLSAEDAHQLLLSEASSVRIPYLLIGITVMVVMLIFLKIKLPSLTTETTVAAFSWKRMMQYPQLKMALVAQFFYVGAQVGIGSFFIRYAVQQHIGNDSQAAQFLSVALLLFMSGRFAGAWIMQWIRPLQLMMVFCLANLLLLAAVILIKGNTGVYALMGTEFFMSVMFPTLFASGIRDLGSDAGYGSSMLIMTIVGGAILPLLMGAVSDQLGIAMAFIVPATAFMVILLCTFQLQKQTTHA